MDSSFSILHLSDLHFGRTNKVVLSNLHMFIADHHQTLRLIIITGDLTQRAKKEEFLAAKDFLESLPVPVFLVPGNHDVPLYNVFLRIFRPYKKFLSFLGRFAQRTYEDRDLCIQGLWSLNRFTVKSGQTTRRDLKMSQATFLRSPEKIKILASHHPLENIERFSPRPHIVMWGHEHQSKVKALDEHTLLIAAGTSTSTRTKEEVNSFNLMTFTGPSIVIDIYGWSPENTNFQILSSAQSILTLK